MDRNVSYSGASMSGDLVIHVVDDDPAVRDSLSFVLVAANWRVRAYEHAAALLARSAALEPGVIITDVRMPRRDGLSVARKLP